jgi:hypothetical protein
VFRFLVLAIAAIFRPGALLIAEKLCLRQQLLVLRRRSGESTVGPLAQLVIACKA